MACKSGFGNCGCFTPSGFWEFKATFQFGATNLEDWDVQPIISNLVNCTVAGEDAKRERRVGLDEWKVDGPRSGPLGGFGRPYHLPYTGLALSREIALGMFFDFHERQTPVNALILPGDPLGQRNLPSTNGAWTTLHATKRAGDQPFLEAIALTGRVFSNFENPLASPFTDELGHAARPAGEVVMVNSPIPLAHQQATRPPDDAFGWGDSYQQDEHGMWVYTEFNWTHPFAQQLGARIYRERAMKNIKYQIHGRFWHQSALPTEAAVNAAMPIAFTD